MKIETPRLVLCFPTPDQIDGFYEVVVGTDIFDTLIWNGPSRVSELHEFWAQAREDFAAGLTRPFSLAMVDRQSGAMVGSAALRPFNGDPEIIDLGYVLARPFHGKGFATEGVGELVHHGFAERGTERCFACVFTGNVASRRVLEKLGFAHEGTMRRSIKKRGQWKDEWIMGLTRPEWQTRARLGRA